MYIKEIIFICLLVLGLSACSTKEYGTQESVFIVFKTPTLKHADLGFIYENNEDIKIEIYGSGQVVMSVEISESTVCTSMFKCLDKKRFNQTLLSEAYPEEIMDNIFRAKPIFQSKGLEKTRNGFTQTVIEAGKYNINYSVLNKQIIFRDTINDILIKVKRLK
jgi:hypothetical protein